MQRFLKPRAFATKTSQHKVQRRGQALITYFLTPFRRPTWKSGRTHWTPSWRQRWQRSSFRTRPFSHLIFDRRHTRQAAALRLLLSFCKSRTASDAGVAAAISGRSIACRSGRCGRTPAHFVASRQFGPRPFFAWEVSSELSVCGEVPVCRGLDTGTGLDERLG